MFFKFWKKREQPNEQPDAEECALPWYNRPIPTSSLHDLKQKLEAERREEEDKLVVTITQMLNDRIRAALRDGQGPYQVSLYPTDTPEKILLRVAQRYKNAGYNAEVKTHENGCTDLIISWSDNK
ncbi:hypothetical protein HPC37_02890 [Pasteurellaceae bacterium 20609_3]|uniref:hypothetical protein n=1 Tax=Spirabiliibacterium mucosae TaxID=28156 RepID=UPI001AACDED0|nr:hypothetical protein [Spirabiliibacterium mucosae]MBE2897801.1 hypothetical protein [Spirabiliibacterium mucosae]